MKLLTHKYQPVIGVYLTGDGHPLGGAPPPWRRRTIFCLYRLSKAKFGRFILDKIVEIIVAAEEEEEEIYLPRTITI